jgi:hydrogenase maturation protease
MKTLVAGLGNIFFGDDAFGSEVARRLLTGSEPLPDDVKVTDFPGTIYVIEPDLDSLESESGLSEAGIADAHGMDPVSVLALLRSLGGSVGRLLVVGCEPADTDEHMGLSPAVAAAIDEAVRVVRELVTNEHSERKESPA